MRLENYLFIGCGGQYRGINRRHRGGLIEPHSLGVGYDTIADELAGNLAVTTLVSIFVIKLIIWAVALGSGTSGGILAPILMMGAALGGLLGLIFPGKIPGQWVLLGMAGALAGVMRSPFTSIIFPIELTHSTQLISSIINNRYAGTSYKCAHFKALHSY